MIKASIFFYLMFFFLRRYNEKYQVLLSKTDFEVVLENLESLEINMVDDGKETDIYFIHE